jgi:DNA-binding protein HU-beta
MNKSDFIDAIASNADVPKNTAAKVVNSFIEVVGDTMNGGDSITLVGFGTFLVRDRQARTGRNPQTGETMQIPAAKVPAFKAGKALKDKVN